MLTDKLVRLREWAVMSKALPGNTIAQEFLAKACDPQTVLELTALFDVAVQQGTELDALRARNAQLEANLLDYWAAHGAVAHIEEPRVVRELRAKVAELEAENTALCTANHEERTRRKEVEELADSFQRDANHLREHRDASRATVERVRELVAAWETWEESMRSWNGEKADVVADAVAELRSALQPEAQP